MVLGQLVYLVFGRNFPDRNYEDMFFFLLGILNIEKCPSVTFFTNLEFLTYLMKYQKLRKILRAYSTTNCNFLARIKTAFRNYELDKFIYIFFVLFLKNDL